VSKRGPTSAADAGFAGVGRSGRFFEEPPIEVVMLCEAERTSIGTWAVLGSNQ